MAVDLRQLRYFIAVAEEGHVTRAAERLGMQQPPLSRQIRAIERQLDLQLFRRKARGVELTDAGRDFLDHGRDVLARLDHALEAARRTARGEQGRIRVGVPPTGPFHPFVPRTIRAFREAFPLVSVTLEESLSRQVVARLADGLLDVGFLRATVDDPQGLAIIGLPEEPMVVALPAGHALARGGGGAPLPLRSLSRELFIVYGRLDGPALYDATMAACLGAGFTPRIAQEAPRITTTLGLVAVGLGIAVVPASMERMAMDGVVYRPLAGDGQPRAVLNLASRRGDPSAVVRNFLALVRRAARDFDTVGTSDAGG